MNDFIRVVPTKIKNTDDVSIINDFIRGSIYRDMMYAKFDEQNQQILLWIKVGSMIDDKSNKDILSILRKSIKGLYR